MKKIFAMLFFSLIVILPFEVKALSVDKNNLNLKKGNNETIGLYAEVENEITEINFTLVYTSYDVPAIFNLEPGLIDETPNSISHKIVFATPVTGKIKLGSIRVNVINNPQISVGAVNIHSAKAITATGDITQLTPQTINVTIVKDVEPTVEDKKEEQKVNKNLLKEVKSKIVNIEIKEDIYEYSVNIKSGVEELDLQPIAKDNKYKIDITTQKISELKDDKIIITVKDGENVEEYTVKVNLIKDVEKVEIDQEKFESTYEYKGKWIVLIIVLSVVLFIGLVLNKKK